MFLDPPAAFVVGECIEWRPIGEVFGIIECVVLAMDDVIGRGGTGGDQYLPVAVINRRTDFADTDILSQVDWFLGDAYNRDVA